MVSFQLVSPSYCSLLPIPSVDDDAVSGLSLGVDPLLGGLVRPLGPHAGGGAGEHVALLAETHCSGARLVLSGSRAGGLGDVAQAVPPGPPGGRQLIQAGLNS